MSIKQLVAELMKREGGKKQVNRAQMSEIVGHLSDMIYEQYEPNEHYGDGFMESMYKSGKRRAKRKSKK
jgi:hypothetical protein